jgi:hypothetical protein
VGFRVALSAWSAADAARVLAAVEGGGQVGEGVGEVGEVAAVDAAVVELRDELAQYSRPLVVPWRPLACDRELD